MCEGYVKRSRELTQEASLDIPGSLTGLCIDISRSVGDPLNEDPDVPLNLDESEPRLLGSRTNVSGSHSTGQGG